MGCPTRCGKYLDLCYGSIKGEYKLSLRAPLALTDHQVVYLAPVYKPVLNKGKQREKVCSGVV